MFFKIRKKGTPVVANFVTILFILGLILPINFGVASNSFASEPKISQQSIDILNQIGQAMAEIVEAVTPSIVNISTTRTVKTQGQPNPFFDDPFFRRFFGDRFRLPKEHKTASLGSGVIITSDGYILTSNHVIQSADDIKVTLADKREFKGKIIGSDTMTDIGVIKIDAKDLPAIKMGDSDKLRVGETVLAIGSPYGLSQTVTQGIVSAVGRANVGIADYEDFIQTDAAINPGNSGGALVNVKGELVGINTAIFSTTGGYQGIGFAIPTSMAKNVMDSLISKGKVIRGWLGVTIQPLTPDLAKEFNLKEEKGALIGDVVEGSPAEKAGLKRGDIIIEYEGKKVEDPNQLRNMVANTVPGDKVEMKVIREDKTKTVEITIGELPAEIQKATTSESENLMKGVTVQDLTPEIYDQFNMPKKITGVIVSDVDESSPAAMVLRQGDVIQEIDRKKISNTKDYEKALSQIKPDENILLLIYRGKSSLYITLSGK